MASIESLISNDAFLEAILKAKNGEEVKDLFKKEGIDIDDDQLANLQKAFSEKLESEKIQNASGGSGINWKEMEYSGLSGMGHGGAEGMWIGAGIGAVAGVIDASIKASRGGIKDTWQFVKEALKTSIKSSLVGGTVGIGLSGVSGVLHNIGIQADKGLNGNSSQNHQ